MSYNEYYSEEKYEKLKLKFSCHEKEILKLHHLDDNYCVFLASMYFESIDDYKHLELVCRRMNGTTSKFKYNPISITDVQNDWRKFVIEQREEDLTTLIKEEKLKEEETRKYVENLFRDGVVKTSGTEIDKIMPAVSRFGGGNRAAKKQGIIDKIKVFFEKYVGIV